MLIKDSDGCSHYINEKLVQHVIHYTRLRSDLTFKIRIHFINSLIFEIELNDYDYYLEILKIVQESKNHE